MLLQNVPKSYTKIIKWTKIYENHVLLLMAEILHQLIGNLSHYLQGFIHPRWCRISSINCITFIYKHHFRVFLGCDNPRAGEMVIQAQLPRLNVSFELQGKKHVCQAEHVITVEARNPAPVEVGSLSHYLEVLHFPGGCLGFIPSTVFTLYI